MAIKKKTVKKKTTSTSSGQARYPRHSVKKALRIPESILDQNAGNACTPAEAADYLDMKAHGPFLVEVSSSKKYGFLESPEDGKIKPTELAKKILRPQEENDEVSGLREAVLTAPQISEVYKHYRGENLPDEKFFKNTVTETYKIPSDKTSEFRDIFLKSLTEAGLIQQHGEKIRVIDATEEDGSSTVKTETQKKLEKGVKVSSSDSCFVMQPFAAPLGEYYEKIYKPAIEKAGLKPLRADAELFGTGKIIDQIWRGINNAKVLVAELTTRNPNVFYELGLAHALKKPVVLISSNENDVPFDLQHIRVIYYDVNDPFWGNKLLDKVAENIVSAIRNPEEAIFQSED
ncbi:MAG: hypothetical protein AB2793_12440 [Candidatus Thiodiazotropha sp.]